MGRKGQFVNKIATVCICCCFFLSQVWWEDGGDICFAMRDTMVETSVIPTGEEDKDPTTFSPVYLQKEKAKKVDINNDGKKERVRFFVKKTKKGKYKLTMYVNKKLRFQKTSKEKNWTVIVGNQGRVLLMAGGIKENSPCTELLCYQYKNKKMNKCQDILSYLKEETPYHTWEDGALLKGSYPAILNEDGSLSLQLFLTSSSMGAFQTKVTLSFDQEKKGYHDDSTNMMELISSIKEMTVKKECKFYNVPNSSKGQVIPASVGEGVKPIGLFIRNKDSAFIKVKIRSTISYIEFNQFAFEEYFEIVS